MEPTGETAEEQLGENDAGEAGVAGQASQNPPINPPYDYEFIAKIGLIHSYGLLKSQDQLLYSEGIGPKKSWSQIITTLETPAQLRSQGKSVWPDISPPGNETNPSQQTNNDSTSSINFGNTEVPLDPRLIYVVGDDGSVVYSFTNTESLQAALVDGFVVEGPGGAQTSASSSKITPDAAKSKYTEFWGVPSIMNYNAYINLQAAAGKQGNQYLIDRENQPRFYDVSSQGTLKGENQSSMGELTVTELVNWCQQPENIKFPYKYQDFVFLKWWKKVPLNYMITLRRYTFPVLDSVGSSQEAKKEVKEKNLTPAATAITFLGEDPGNKISTIMGPIEAGLKWKEVKADVWEVSNSGSPGNPDSPLPGLAKALGFLTGGADALKPSDGGPPPDPYNNGPYANKILGPVTVVDNTQARERGITFKHEISLVFEYSARSIGGINSKAALLDILGNLMILTYNEASFWGGMNRYMPQGAGGSLEPFLGGDAGRAAWLQGNPSGFFEALSTQFTTALKNFGDVFSKFLDDPVSGLQSIASGAASSAMKLSSGGSKGFMQGIHSILTGAPVGEWHLTVGSPLNPMMMIGNLICTGIKIEFNDELGPDDFPTELKATITLEHGMPRDRAGIESMFNKGRGRMYSLPKGYEDTFSSTQTSAVDSSTSNSNNIGTAQANRNGEGRNAGGEGGGKAYNPLLGDPQEVNKIFGYYKQSTAPKVKNVLNSVYSHGVKYMDK
jgi:hypothetical protein